MIIGNHEALPGNTHVSSVQTDLKYQLKIFILTMKVTVIILAAIRVWCYWLGFILNETVSLRYSKQVAVNPKN